MSDPIFTDQEQQLPANPEDRKAAAALSSLNNGDSADSGSNLPSTADQEALGNAMSRLDIAGGHASGAGVKKKTAVKVAAEDVNLLVEQLNLNKAKATELLKAHDGDVRMAIRAFIAIG